MDWSICKDLERALECTHSKYIEPRSAAYYRVSTQLAVNKKEQQDRSFPLLQLRVVLGFLQDGNVRVGVFPEGKEILVRNARLRSIPL